MFLIIIAYIYSTTTTSLKNEQFLMNCPAPISNGVATVVNIVDGIRLNYTVATSASQFTTKNYNGTYFDCFIDPITKQPSASAQIKNYGAVLEFFGATVLGYGWFAWVGDTIWSYLDNIQPFISMLYLLIVVPSAVGALTFFSYINLFMLFLIGLGIFLAVRG